MRYFFINILITLYLVAKGTIAGTVIDNKIYITFKIGDSSDLHKVVSNVDSFTVDRVVDIKTTWQDSSFVDVSSNEKSRVLTFRVDNLGNSEENITINYLLENNSTFVPDNAKVYEDKNGNGLFDLNDTVVTRINLLPDKNSSLFIVSDISDVNGTLSYNSIIATIESVEDNSSSTDRETATYYTLTNSSIEDDSSDKIDTVIKEDTSKATGVYSIRDYFLETTKSAKILSSDGKLHTGTEVEYTINVKIVGGSGEYRNIVIQDSIDSKTIYINNTLSLNDKILSDLKDSDSGEFNNNKIVVRVDKLSNLETKNNLIKIKFRVKIK